MMRAVYMTVCLFANSGIGQPPASEAKPAPTIREFSLKDLPQPVTIADVIKRLGLDESKMSYRDEPPGKLRALYWHKVKLPGTGAEMDVEIQLENPRSFAVRKLVEIQLGTPPLITEKRTWDIKMVRAATVLKVTITPHKRFD
jgi:hypothetical protein